MLGWLVSSLVCWLFSGKRSTMNDQNGNYTKVSLAQIPVLDFVQCHQKPILVAHWSGTNQIVPTTWSTGTIQSTNSLKVIHKKLCSHQHVCCSRKNEKLWSTNWNWYYDFWYSLPFISMQNTKPPSRLRWSQKWGEHWWWLLFRSSSTRRKVLPIQDRIIGQLLARKDRQKIWFPSKETMRLLEIK